ncbi:hypothetical protein M9H77_30314 [Catharanthus roseus]|uniref:Uncharacterized protein n=1 Tax=Catharanthus roseus TaxID=4058 RepID=A0ACB9ZWX5_CATRO|nr:hypothetical protein M9H77_30314 [Catharanthus roseus]
MDCRSPYLLDGKLCFSSPPLCNFESSRLLVLFNLQKLGVLRNVIEPSLIDLDQKRQEPMDVKLQPTNRAQKKKLKILEANEAIFNQRFNGYFKPLNCRLARGVKDLKRVEEANYEQSSGRDFGEHIMHANQLGYGNFSPHARSYEHNSYDCYEGNRFGTRNDFRNGGNYVNMNDRFHKRKGDYKGYYDSYNNFKLLLLCGTFGPYDYEAWEQKVESLFYSYCLREEDKFPLLLKSLSYKVNVWWDSKC